MSEQPDSLWWPQLDEFVAELNAVAPTPREQEILIAADHIRAAHRLRIAQVMARYGFKTPLAFRG